MDTLLKMPYKYYKYSQSYYDVPQLSAFAIQLHNDTLSLSAGTLELSAFEATGFVDMPNDPYMSTELMDYINQINFIKSQVIRYYYISLSGT